MCILKYVKKPNILCELFNVKITEIERMQVSCERRGSFLQYRISDIYMKSFEDSDNDYTFTIELHT